MMLVRHNDVLLIVLAWGGGGWGGGGGGLMTFVDNSLLLNANLINDVRC